jgi:hypothetical protein
MAIAFEDTNLPLVETVSNEDEDDDDIEDADEASNAGSEMSMSEYDGSVTGLPPWCLFAVKECCCIFELGSDKSVSIGSAATSRVAASAQDTQPERRQLLGTMNLSRPGSSSTEG